MRKLIFLAICLSSILLQAQDQAGDAKDAVYKVGAGITPPRVIYHPQPEYPKEASKLHQEGTVTLQLVIDRTGATRDVKVLSSSSPLFNEPAIDTVMTWRFEPATRNGEPVNVSAKIDVDFHLYSQNEQYPSKWEALICTRPIHATPGVPVSNAEALFAEGCEAWKGYEQRVDQKKGLGLFRQAAEAGSADAQFFLGGLYKTGKQLPQSNTEALRWFRIAEANGSSDAKKEIEKLTNSMKKKDVERAQHLAEEWLASHSVAAKSP